MQLVGVLRSGRPFHLFLKNGFGFREEPPRLQLADQAEEIRAELARRFAAMSLAEFVAGGGEEVDRLLVPVMAGVDCRHQVGQMQPVERALLGRCLEASHNPQLFGSQLRLFGEGDEGQDLGELPRLAGGPCLLLRPLQRGESRGDVRAGLVLNLGGAALHEELEQIEGPQIDRALRPAANLGDVFGELVDRRLVVNLAENPFDAADERIDLAAGVADDGVGEGGQQAEILRAPVVPGDSVEALLRAGSLGEVSLVSEQIVRIDLAMLGVTVEQLPQGVFIHRLVEGDFGLGVLGVLLGSLAPGGEGVVVGGSQLAG